MTPADFVRADRLADLVCHDEQMTIWEGDVLEELEAFLRLPRDQEELMQLRQAANSAIRHIVTCAFSHPEILGLPTGKTQP